MGGAALPVSASRPAPLPSRRRFIRSQVYYLGGEWESWGQISLQSTTVNPLTVLVFGDDTPMASPTWKDVGPVLSQYARIYPGMAARLDLSNYEAVKHARDVVLQVITLPFDDPAAMPVTRDLSAYDREMIVAWIKVGCPSEGVLPMA
jgi:hypothetical protein